MKKFVKFIGYLIVALLLSVPFNWFGNWIGDFLVNRSTHSVSGSPFMTIGLNFLTIVLIILVVVALLAALFIGPYLIYVLVRLMGEDPNETDNIELGLGWFYCLNIYVILQILYLKYPNNDLVEFFAVVGNVVFGIVLLVYIAFAGALIFYGFKLLIRCMHERPKQKSKSKSHFDKKSNIKF